MDETSAATVFKLKPSRQETKADTTTRAAREIIDSEASAREAKTQRLRAARLAIEAIDKPTPAAKKKKTRKG